MPNLFQNPNNIAQKTNFILGTSKIPKSVFMVQSVSIPGISVNHVTGIGGRFGVQMKVGADNSEYSDVTFEVLLDEDLVTFREVMKLMQAQVHPGDGVFEDTDWEFWLLANNNKGHPLFRIDFIHSRLSSISDISLDSMDDGNNTMSLTITYDWYEISEDGMVNGTGAEELP